MSIDVYLPKCQKLRFSAKTLSLKPTIIMRWLLKSNVWLFTEYPDTRLHGCGLHRSHCPELGTAVRRREILLSKALTLFCHIFIFLSVWFVPRSQLNCTFTSNLIGSNFAISTHNLFKRTKNQQKIIGKLGCILFKTILITFLAFSDLSELFMFMIKHTKYFLDIQKKKSFDTYIFSDHHKVLR